MSSWNSIDVKIDPFEPIKPPLKSVLVVLETVEAVLESLLAVIKAFSADASNPLKSIVAVLLAAIRSIINQLKSSGFSVLLIHPDFSQSDFGAVLHSVSGSYPGFENKVIAKFHDPTDMFRPTYPKGSHVSMFVFYIGTESPGDLMAQIFALLSLIKHPQILSGLPAPVNLKVRPVNKSGTAISRFKKLFDTDLDKALQLEWQMPMSPGGGNAPGFINSLVSFYDGFRFPNFVIERSSAPQGSVVQAELKTQTAGPIITSQQQRFSFSASETNVIVRESGTNNPVKHFEHKKALNSATGLTEGAITGTYRFLDTEFSDEDRGKNFHYRVRAYFGNPNNYISAKNPSDYLVQTKSDGHNKMIYDFGDGVTMGNPSAIVRGFVPRSLPSGAVFNLYDDIYRAVQAGLLLNFDFPPAQAGDDAFVQEQKTGWGTLSLVAGQIGPIKSSYKSSSDLKNSFLFKSAVRRIANQCSVSLYANPALADVVASKWSAGALEAVNLVEETKRPWQLIGITSGYTTYAREKISSYLELESYYIPGMATIPGPLPVTALTPDNPDPTGVGVVQRQALADFLKSALIPLSGQSKYLVWYSITLGDVFPAFIPFIFDFEQFLLALLMAVKGALEELEDIIQTITTKIKQLEAILETILNLINLLSIKVSVSILRVDSENGSAADLASAILSSENKPSSKPFGLHSGMVLTVGGPGEGSVAALKAIAYILRIPTG